MTEEGPRVALEDNDDGKGQEPAPAQEGTEQGENAKGEEGKKSGWSSGLSHFCHFSEQLADCLIVSALF